MRLTEGGFLAHPDFPERPPVGTEINCLQCNANYEVMEFGPDENKSNGRRRSKFSQGIGAPNGTSMLGWFVKCLMCGKRLFIPWDEGATQEIIHQINLHVKINRKRRR